MSEVAFGNFDLSQRDHRPGVTRRTTHAFWRTPSGQWKLMALTGPDQGWKDAAFSRFPMSALRFGDFDDDGVTDVLAVEDGHWAISSGAVGSWSRINPWLGDNVRGLYIADVNHNNKDDLIRLKHRVESHGMEVYVLTIDRDGVGQFYAPLESRVGAKPDWTSTFRY